MQLCELYLGSCVWFYHKDGHGVNRPIYFTLFQYIQIDMSFMVNVDTGCIDILTYMQIHLVQLKYDLPLFVHTINLIYSTDINSSS